MSVHPLVLKIRSRHPILLVSLAWMLFVLGMSRHTFSHAISNWLILSAILGIAAVGLDVLVGGTGQLALVNAALLGLGAYTAAIVSKRWELSALLTVPMAAVAGAVVAAVIGIVSLRLRSFYFAIITLSFALLFDKIVVVWSDVTGGASGFIGIPALGDGSIVRVNTRFWILLAGGLLGLSVVIAVALYRSKVGQAWQVIRTDEVLAVSLGIRPLRYKMLAFVLSGALAGLAGSLYAYYLQFLSPSDFGFPRLIDLLLMVFIGGAATGWGPALGAIAIQALALFEGDPDTTNLLKAVALLIVLGLAPSGVVGGIKSVISRARSRLSQPRPTGFSVASEPAGTRS